mgnify:FL=1
MRISRFWVILLVLAFTMGLSSCGGEKGKVVNYLEKIDKYVSSDEYKKAGMDYVEQSITASPNGEKMFDENKFNELIMGLVESKDLEICKSVGFKDREEAGALVNKYIAEPEIKSLTEKIDKAMTDMAMEFQKEGMAKVNASLPPQDLSTPPQNNDKSKK